jgi:uncharacterized protein YkwD
LIYLDPSIINLQHNLKPNVKIGVQFAVCKYGFSCRKSIVASAWSGRCRERKPPWIASGHFIPHMLKGYFMPALEHLVPRIVALSVAMLLTACGGGDSGSGRSDSAASVTRPSSSQQLLSQEPNAPQATGDTSTDGFNWFNFRRKQMGLSEVTRNRVIDTAAQGHSDYQRLNDTITHTQISGKPGFTGVAVPDRLRAAGYVFDQSRYSYGEVIAAIGGTSGFYAAEGLIDAIYHRFVIFEPVFREAGFGTGSVPNGYTYFTTKFAANGLGPGLGQGKVALYPFANQQNVPVIFYSDREIPDPVPNQNEVGYPISVHADATASVTVQTFTVRPRGGSPLSVRLLSRATDADTSGSVAAIVPYSVLSAKTTYDVQFIGTVDNTPVNRSWSFTTR